MLQQGKRIMENLGGDILGLFRADLKEFFMYGTTLTISEDEIKRMIEERAEAKKGKDFNRADEIRKNLLEKGVVLEDGAKGTTWKVA